MILDNKILKQIKEIYLQRNIMLTSFETSSASFDDLA